MQGIYSYIPRTNHVSSLYSVAGVLSLQFVLHVMLFCTLNTICTCMSVLSIECVQCPLWFFFLILVFIFLQNGIINETVYIHVSVQFSYR